ncbi:MAG: bifunctional precorrin-2 dehydrogenase/sirohydrochlorin ferrochelatase [Planctomycetota bacterium]|nr:bifunctional precorrin-2 dehydrogenase/sirohydrochlorin ferrochelatase [Planctomycetota bacterium]
MARASAEGYPVYLDLRETPVLVVGGGAVAARKVRELARCGARITLVAPKVHSALARRKGLALKRRGFRTSDLRGARLVFAATDDPALNARLAKLARGRGLWCNVAAPPETGDLTLPAVVRRGRLSVAISTGGVSAAAAKALREELERRLDPGWGPFLALLEARRARIKRRVPDPAARRKLLQALGSPRWVRELRRRGCAETARRMDALIAKALEQRA